MNQIFSREVTESISCGREEARRLGNTFLGPEHLLLGLLRQGDNAAFYMLKCRPVDICILRDQLERSLQDEVGTSAPAGTSGASRISAADRVPLTRQAEKVIRDSFYIAESFTSKEVEPEYLMLSLLQESNAAPILHGMGVDYASFLKELV